MKYSKPRKPIHLRESIWDEEKRLKMEAKKLSETFKNQNNGSKFQN